MGNTCRVCNNNLTHCDEDANIDNRGGQFFNCSKCGRYILSGTSLATIDMVLDNSDERIALVSHAIRKRDNGNEPVFISSTDLENYIKSELPKPKEQATLLVLWLGEKTNPGEVVSFSPSLHQSIIGAISPNGFELVLQHLIETGVLNGDLTSTMGRHGYAEAKLSIEGWDYYDELKRGAINSRKIFMAMKFGDNELDIVVDDHFKEAVRQTGFELFRVDDVPSAGLIDDKIRVDILTSKLIISDLSHDNNGAYWEAGYAEGLGKPVIYTCEKEKFESEKSHFDTNHHLTISWDKNNPDEAAENLKATIRATLPNDAILED